MNRGNKILLIVLLLLIYLPVLGFRYAGVGVQVPDVIFVIMVLPLALLLWASPIIVVAVIVFKIMERRRAK